MTYRIRLTDRASRDLDRHLRNAAEHSLELGERLAARFETALGRLETFPYSCGLAHENPRFDEELRHLMFWTHPRRKYRALFVVRDDEAVILAIGAPGERPINPAETEG